jgi:hypothetical protein
VECSSQHTTVRFRRPARRLQHTAFGIQHRSLLVIQSLKFAGVVGLTDHDEERLDRLDLRS